MPTLTAKLEPDTAAVHLVVTDPGTVEAIVRTDANGTRDVRLPANKPLTADAPMGFLEYRDYEVALGGTVSYRLVHPDFDRQVWVDMDRPEPWAPRFSLPFQPLLTAPVDVVTAYDADTRSLATFHEVIGRRDPLVIQGGQSLRRGTLVAEFDTHQTARELQYLVSRGQVVLYRQTEHPGLDMFFHTDGTALSTDAETGIWSLSVSYIETVPPVGGTGATYDWNFHDLPAAYRSFTSLSRSHESFADLTVGKRK